MPMGIYFKEYLFLELVIALPDRHVVRETSQAAATECRTDVYPSPEARNIFISFSTDFECPPHNI